MDTSRFLTRRYVVALSLIGLVLLGSHFYLTHQLSTGRSDAVRINRSGMQRMLSQQIALRAERILHADDERTARNERQIMTELLATMADNAEFLSAPLASGGYTEPVRRVYEDRGGVLERVSDFLAHANRIVDGSASDDEIRALAPAAAETLRICHAAVLAHQQEAEGRTSTFVSIERVLLILGLLVLLLEARFIFRPMVALVGKTIQALGETNAELESLAYQMPHDLRAPIASARGLLSVVEDELDDIQAKEAKIPLRLAQDSMRQLDDIVTRIIAVVRVRGEGKRTPKEWIELDEVFDQAVAKAAHLRGDVDVHHSRTALRAWTSRSCLQQAVDHLVSNAIKYANGSCSKARVELEALEAKSHFVLRVRDNGLGIPEAQRAKLFGMFKRFHPSVANGNGLGLYLARESARAMGGDIVYAACDPGSMFEVHFPKTTPNTAPSTAAQHLGQFQ